MGHLRAFGIDYQPTSVELEVASSSLTRWFSQFAAVEGRVALLDNSLLSRVAALLGRNDLEGRPSSEGLIALNAWLNAVVFFDDIVHLQNPDVPQSAWMAGTDLASMFREITCDLFSDQREQQYPGLHEYLELIVKGGLEPVRDIFSQQSASDRVWQSWEASFGSFEGRGERRLGWPGGPARSEIKFDSDWVPKHWSSVATYVTDILGSPELSFSPEALLDADIRSGLEAETLAEVLTDSSVRAFANMRIATRAGVHYVPSPVRMPLLYELKIAEAQRWFALEQMTLEEVRQWAKESEVVRHLVGDRKFELPPLLAGVIWKARTLDEIVPLAAQLRRMASAYRKTLHEAETNIRFERAEYQRVWTDARRELEAVQQSFASLLAKGAAAAAAAALVHEVGGYVVGQVLLPATEWAVDAFKKLESLLSKESSAARAAVLKQLLARARNRPAVFIAHLIKSDRQAAGLHINGIQALWGLGPDRASRIATGVERFSQSFFQNLATTAGNVH